MNQSRVICQKCLIEASDGPEWQEPSVAIGTKVRGQRAEPPPPSDSGERNLQSILTVRQQRFDSLQCLLFGGAPSQVHFGEPERRQLHDMRNTLFDWRARRITAHFAEDRIDLSTEYGELILNVLVSFAQMERQLTASRCREVRAVIVAEGKFAGGTGPPPFWKLQRSGGSKKLVHDRL